MVDPFRCNGSSNGTDSTCTTSIPLGRTSFPRPYSTSAVPLHARSPRYCYECSTWMLMVAEQPAGWSHLGEGYKMEILANNAEIPQRAIQLSVVVPIYNERDLLLQMAEQLAPHLDEIAGRGNWQFVL